MELSSAEVFLLAWCAVSTISTAYLAHKVQQLKIAKLVIMRTLIGMGIGKVKAEIVDGGIKFHDVEEEENKQE